MISMTHIKPQVKLNVKRALVESYGTSLDNLGMGHQVGDIIKTRLKALGKTQGWLAEKADVSDTAVSKWVATGKISRASATVVADILEIPVIALMGLDDTPASSITPQLALVYVTRDEQRILTAYREATPMGQALIMTAADGAPRKESVAFISNLHKL